MAKREAGGIIRVLGVGVMVYVGFLIMVWLIFLITSRMGGAQTQPPSGTTWFWECRQREVYGEPFLPLPDFVGKAPDETKCGSQP